MSTTEINNTTAPAKKTTKKIYFRRSAIKRYYENYTLTYKDFVAKISKDGWEGKEIKDKNVIKELWDNLAEQGSRCWDDSAVVIDVDADAEFDAEDDEDWDEDDAEENVWMYIHDEVSYDDCFPECAEEGCNSNVINEGEKCEECSKTPEQKEAEAKKKEKNRLEWIAKVEEDRLKQIAWREEKEKKAEEYAKKQKEERIENAPETIRQAILTVAELYNARMDEARIAEDGEEQWKVKAMKNVARQRILDQMKDLVVQLKMVAKW
jgi:hypothetical protein